MNILITAIGSMSALEVVGTLSAIPSAKVFGCDIYPAVWLPVAARVKAFLQVPRCQQENAYVQALLGFCEEQAIDYLMPLTDLEVDVLSLHRQAFARRGVVLCLPDAACIALCRDKLQVHDFFRDDDQLKPIKTCPLAAWVELSEPYPLIVKPRRGRSSEGLAKVANSAALQTCLVGDNVGEMIVQPMLEGSIYVADVLVDANSQRAVTVCRRELLRTSNGAGLTVELCPDPALAKLALHAALRLRIIGCVNLEFIKCAGRYWLMDVNPRFSAGVVFSRMAGYDMVLNTLRSFAGQPIDDPVTYGTDIITRHYVETLMSSEEGYDDR